MLSSRKNAQQWAAGGPLGIAQLPTLPLDWSSDIQGQEQPNDFSAQAPNSAREQSNDLTGDVVSRAMPGAQSIHLRRLKNYGCSCHIQLEHARSCAINCTHIPSVLFCMTRSPTFALHLCTAQDTLTGDDGLPSFSFKVACKCMIACHA